MRCAGVVIWLICVAAISGCSASTHEDQAPVTLDLGRNYGDVFADGRLPVGDGKVVTEAPRRGCRGCCAVRAGSGAEEWRERGGRRAGGHGLGLGDRRTPA